MSSHIKDRVGYEFDELVAIQTKHLDSWAGKLIPQFHAEICAYVRKNNRPAATPEDKHYVLRGQDIVQVMIDWPNLTTVYPPIKPPEAAAEDVL